MLGSTRYGRAVRRVAVLDGEGLLLMNTRRVRDPGTCVLAARDALLTGGAWVDVATGELVGPHEIARVWAPDEPLTREGWRRIAWITAAILAAWVGILAAVVVVAWAVGVL